MNELNKLVAEIYGKSVAKDICKKIEDIVKIYAKRKHSIKKTPSLSEKDVVLICYADNIRYKNEPSLKVMDNFFNEFLGDRISYIHFLPFFPYSSDDGFAITNFRTVNPKYGSWKDIRKISRKYGLIFDAVTNHISSKHKWFQNYLKFDKKYEDYFIEMDKNADVSKVMRARDLPLLNKFQKGSKDVFVWTTFSDDQIDLNFHFPKVLLEVIDLLLFYASKGASIIRLDAIAYIWKKANSNCINLKEVHKIIMIIRRIFDMVFPHIMLLPEANVPSKENLKYLGNGYNEAQLLYQFCISPLVLYTFYSGSVDHLHNYLDTVPELPGDNYFLNVLVTHDGIGLRPVHDILDPNEIKLIINEIEKRNGIISYKTEQNGKKSPYELNITYFDALRDNDCVEKQNIAKFVAAQAILLSIKGLPALYFHSLFGTKNYYEGYENTNQPRTLNRRKFELNELENLLSNKEYSEAIIFKKINKLLSIRKKYFAFHPNAKQEIVNISDHIFSIIRKGKEDNYKMLILVNVTDQKCNCKIPQTILSNDSIDIIAKRKIIPEIEFTMYPYEILWIPF